MLPHSPNARGWRGAPPPTAAAPTVPARRKVGYRCCLAFKVRGLRVVDGREVTDEERGRAAGLFGPPPPPGRLPAPSVPSGLCHRILW